MAGNEYRRYLNGEEYPRRSFLGDVTKGVGIAAGILVGGVATYRGLQYLNESGALVKGLGKLNKGASYIDSYLSGLNKTFSDEGVFKTLLGGAPNTLKTNMQEAFRTHAVTELRGAGGNTLGGAPTRFERWYSKQGKARQELADSVITGVRLDDVLAQVREKQWIRDNPELGKAVEEMILNDKSLLHAGFDRQYDVDILRSKGQPYNRETAIDNALKNAVEHFKIDKRFGDVPAVASGLKSIGDILKEHGSKSTFVGNNNAVIREQLASLRTAHDKQSLEFNKRVTAGTNIIKNMFQDIDLLTVGKATEMGLFDYTSITTKAPKRSGDIGTYMLRPGALRSMPGLESMPIDPLVFISKSGQVMDFRAGRSAASKTMKGLSNIQIPFINISPFRLLTIFNRESLENTPNYVFRRENVNSVLKFIGKDLPKDDYYFMGGNIINRQGQTVANDIRLAKSKFGLFQREMSSIAGYTRKSATEPEHFIDYVKNIYDIGNQEYPSTVSRKFSGVTKFWDLDWERNMWYNMKGGKMGGTPEEVNAFLSKTYSKFSNTVDNMTSGLSSDTLEAISSRFDPEIYKIMKQGTKKEGTMNAIFKLMQDDTLRDDTKREFTDIIKRYMNDPEGFERIIRTRRKGYQADLPEMLESFRINATETVSSIDQAEKLLHMELLYRSQDLSKGATVGSMVKEMLAGGQLTKKQANEVLDLYVLNDMRNLGKRGHLSQPEKFLGLVINPQGESQKAINEHMQQMIFQANPNFGVGPGTAPESFFPGNEFIPVRKGQFLSRTGKMISDINSIVKAGGGVAEISAQGVGEIGQKLKAWGLETLGELGFGTKKYRAGRENLDKVTTTTFGSYHFLYRLNETISKLGFGLSTKNMGSAQDIAKNLYMRRMLGPLATIMGLSYLNYELGELTGEKPNQTLARTYAQMTMDVQGAKDFTGLNALSQSINRALPGFDLLYKNPLGMALKYGSFGLFGEDRGYDEMKYYYEKGHDPIRKGRFWGFGSNTPFYGDRVEYFAPSWYRRVMGEPQFTDALYGSESEYWAHSWLPNPRNLFGVLPLLDPYHWENKHREDRPYPTTGGTAFRQIPLVGPIIDMPISGLIKPARRHPGLSKAHEDFLEEINTRYKAFINEANRGAMLQLYPGGRIAPVAYTDEGLVYGEGGGAGTGYGTGIAGGVGGGPVAGGGGVLVSGDPTTGYAPARGRSMARGQISRINQSYVAFSNVKPIDGRSIALLRDHTYVESLNEAMDPNSLAYRLGETAYSFTEMGGMYGFLTNTIFGLEDRMAPRVQLQASNRMYNLERTFWDMGLGGLGGDLSEIYRRFLPHRRRQIKEYNPLPNQMPSWMPGLDYFTDFKHGDPYIKIPQGEGRLPGPGYEAMNKLHSDPIFGRYGALDRFKILADVAPWSEQYRYYNSVISKMREDSLISERDYSDVQRVRDMVLQRKEKYDLYPYRYKYADAIEKKTVTVERMIDATTFLSDEMPGVPIRMAGIDLPSKESEDYQEIVARISRYLSPGKKVRIGIESDALMRVKDDTMNTMSAVIYDEWGDPLQAKLARTKWGAFAGFIGGRRSVKGDYEDTSATTVNAMFEDNTITVGKAWEAFAHLDTPIHTKFLKIRSPLEHYKRQMLYGKDWQSWSHPIRDWVMPTVDKLASGNPLISASIGAALGSLFTKGPKAKAIAAIAGGFIGGIPSSIRAMTEAAGRITGDTDYTWVPRRRRLERDIEEYFDMLKYVKYRGLYEKTRQMAISSEGLDPEAIVQYSESRGGKNAKERRRLENIKRWLKIYDTDNADLKSVNRRLTEISGDKLLVNAGPMTMRALQYRAEYMATLYGADPYGDLQTIYRALPKKDRPFFKYFMMGTPEEREEILRLVPKNQRRFYQAKWNLKVDRKPSVEEYFLSHHLPDAGWAGWKPGVSLEAIKLKFVQNTALDIGEFGFWADDAEYAKNAPEVPSIYQNPLSALDIMRLTKVLRGAGIENADVQIFSEVTDSPDDLFNINMNMRQDRTDDIKKAMNDNMAYLLAE